MCVCGAGGEGHGSSSWLPGVKHQGTPRSWHGATTSAIARTWSEHMRPSMMSPENTQSCGCTWSSSRPMSAMPRPRL